MECPVPQRTLSTPAVERVETPRHRRGLALTIIVTCQLMLILDATVMNVALPRIQAGLHFSGTGLAWVMSAYTLTFGGLLLLGGRAGDILGRRRMFVGGIALFTLASLAGGFATSSGWLLAARALQGIGAAAAGPSTIALITTTFTEPRERLRALALLSGVASGGFAIGLTVGGLLTDLGSWRWVLFVNVPFGLAAVVLAPRYVREPQRHPARLDLPAAAVRRPEPGGRIPELLPRPRRDDVDVLLPHPVPPGGTRVQRTGHRVRVPADGGGHVRDDPADPTPPTPDGTQAARGQRIADDDRRTGLADPALHRQRLRHRVARPHAAHGRRRRRSRQRRSSRPARS
jgi:hypothetical protein